MVLTLFEAISSRAAGGSKIKLCTFACTLTFLHLKGAAHPADIGVRGALRTLLDRGAAVIQAEHARGYAKPSPCTTAGNAAYCSGPR